MFDFYSYDDGTWFGIIAIILLFILMILVYIAVIAVIVFVCGYIILWLLQYFGVLQHFGIGMLMGMV